MSRGMKTAMVAAGMAAINRASAASAGYVSMVDNADSVAFQLGIMRNVECEISRAARKRFQNWQLVRDYLLQHTSKGGSTSCYHHCRWMGVDPEGYSFR